MNENAKTSSRSLAVFWVAVASVIATAGIGLMMARTHGRFISEISVRVQDAEIEKGLDPQLPLANLADSLPDFEVVLELNGDEWYLGAHYNQSAINGLVWTPSEPVLLSDVDWIRLQERDPVVSDVVAEYQPRKRFTEANGFEFDISLESDWVVGVSEFTPTKSGRWITSLLLVELFVAGMWLVIRR